MVVNNEKQKEVLNSSTSSTTAAVVEHHDLRGPNEKAGPYDLEAGRSSERDHSPSISDGGRSSSSSSSSASHHSDDGDNEDLPAPPTLTRLSTNVSLGPDNPVEHYTSYVPVPDAVYDRFSARRKLLIVALLSYCAFLAPISSTTVLSATPEVAAEFHTTGSIVGVTNALYLLFMGISPIVWGPFSEVWGRKVVSRRAGHSRLN